ncbi:MAG TPA: YceI family protein [Anaeromyxobacter sp.]
MRRAAVAAAVIATVARAEVWEAAPAEDSRIVVHAYKKGFFAAFAHDHHFEVTQWRVTANVPERGLASSSIEAVLSAASLRDRQERLSEADRRKVDGQAAGPEVLDAEHHPRIEFRSERFELEPGGGAEHLRGAVRGTLTLRGRTGPATVNVEAERAQGVWRVRGDARVNQSSFGIRPFSGFGGTVGVKDELVIELSLTLRPRRR